VVFPTPPFWFTTDITLHMIFSIFSAITVFLYSAALSVEPVRVTESLVHKGYK
jgi:hypothetical protein